MVDVIKTPYLSDEVSAAVWNAYRIGKVTYVDDEHGHIAAIVPPASVKSVLTLNDAGLLGDLLRAVQGNYRLRYYPNGAEGDTDHPVEGVLRAFTLEGGGFYPNNDDVRNAYVWTSGFMERWYKVSDLIRALDNIDGKHGLGEPMAVLEAR
jgi:hypothetical protein